MYRTLAALFLLISIPTSAHAQVAFDTMRSIWVACDDPSQPADPNERLVDPVHDRATRTTVSVALGRPPRAEDPVVHEFLAGQQWSDDPEGLLATGIQPWCKRFQAAQKASRSGAVPGPREPLFERTLFGDLQFVHGMAGRIGEPAEVTARNVDRWLEFDYRVGTGDIAGTVKLSKVPVEGFPLLFPHSPHTVAELLRATGTGISLTDRALGNALHLLQDMIGAGHVKRQKLPDRASPQVVSYFTHAQSTHAEHRNDVGWREVGDRGGTPEKVEQMQFAIQRGVDLLRLAKRNTPWAKVKPLFDSYFFELTDLKAPAVAVRP